MYLQTIAKLKYTSDLNPKYTIFFFILLLVTNSCCFGVKEDYLGSNLYLSESDSEDRRILYQKESYSSAGIEIVPMTVTEIAHNSEWILAKSENKMDTSNLNYWIVLNKYEEVPDVEMVKANSIGPVSLNSFINLVKEKAIKLELIAIEK